MRLSINAFTAGDALVPLGGGTGLTRCPQDYGDDKHPHGWVRQTELRNYKELAVMPGQEFETALYELEQLELIDRIICSDGSLCRLTEKGLNFFTR